MNAWTIYVVAVLLLLASLYYLTRRWGPLPWRLVALLVLATSLLTPARVPEVDALAPAWQVATFAYLFGSGQQALQALWPLGLLLLGFATVLALLIWQRRRSRNPS